MVDVNGALRRTFDSAVWFVNTRTAGKLPRVELASDEKLRLYGLFKRSTAGVLDVSRNPRPGGGAQQVMWDSWYSTSKIPECEAMETYVNLLFQVPARVPSHMRRQK
jgi:acyl-CoA-binding protein